MKKRTWICGILTAVLLILSACGSAASASADVADAAAEPAMAEAAMAEPDGGIYEEAAAADAAEMDTAEAGAGPETSAGMLSGTGSGSLTDKIIYSAYGELETTDFDGSLAAINTLVDQYGAFVESSSVTGNDLQTTATGGFCGRTAQFTLRVPREHYSDLTAALDTVGNVTYLTSDAENITAQYSDVEAQVKSYDTQEQRLLEIMAQADTVEDMITLESRLSDVRMERERLEAQLQNWDRLVDYSTVSLFLTEVQELTPEPPEQEPSYLQQLGGTFMDSVHWMGQAARTGLKLLVAVIPVLLPIGVVILIVVLSCKAASKRKRNKQAEVLREQKKEDEET